MKTTLVSRIVLTGLKVSALGCLLASTGCTHVPQSTTFGDPAAARVQLPAPLRTVAAEYPWEMRRAGISGVVNVQCTVDERGNTHEIKVANYTNDKFIRPALEAIKQWTFTPGTRNGTPCAVRISVPLMFTLD